MANLFTKIKNVLLSLKLAVALLALLCIYVVWGTLYQADAGLYAAQEKFFNSIILWMGPIPLPSVQIIIWLMFINILAAMIWRIKFSLRKIGLWINHAGILMLLVSGFSTLYFSQESFVQLYETEQSSEAEDYYEWELLISRELQIDTSDKVRHDKFRLTSKELTADKLPEKIVKEFNEFDFNLKVLNYYPNAKYFDTPFAGRILKEMPLAKEQESNFPGLVLEFSTMDGKDYEKLKLQALTDETATIPVLREAKQMIYSFILQRRPYDLPISVELVDVKRDLHPGTKIAKAYKSIIRVHDGSALARETTISMNKPFRYQDYTFFQSSYGINADGQEFTVLAVVKNSARLLPYVASLLASLGLLIHFLMEFYYRRRKANA